MGLFKRLFAKKEGGTRAGNFLRQLAYNNTYGLLGQDLGQSYAETLHINGAIGKAVNNLLKSD